MTTITRTDTAVQTPFDDVAFDEARTAHRWVASIGKRAGLATYTRTCCVPP